MVSKCKFLPNLHTHTHTHTTHIHTSRFPPSGLAENSVKVRFVFVVLFHARVCCDVVMWCSDFGAWYRVVEQLPGVGFYNSAVEAGASQGHKHMQVRATARLTCRCSRRGGLHVFAGSGPLGWRCFFVCGWLSRSDQWVAGVEDRRHWKLRLSRKLTLTPAPPNSVPVLNPIRYLKTKPLSRLLGVDVRLCVSTRVGCHCFASVSKMIGALSGSDSKVKGLRPHTPPFSHFVVPLPGVLSLLAVLRRN